MGKCQSACCPPSDCRPKPNKSRSGDVHVPVAAQQLSEATGSMSSAGIRYRIDTHDHGDHSKECNEQLGDNSRSATVSGLRISSDGKTGAVDLPRQQSDRTSEKKRIGSNSSDSAYEVRANKMFERYCDCAEEDCIAVNGIEQLCSELNFDPEDFHVLLFAWQCGAQAMCRLTRAEFIAGCKRLRADSASLIASKLPGIRDEICRDQSQFRDLYRWAYSFALDSSILQRALPVDMAIAMWRLVFSGLDITPAVLPRWIDYLEKRSTEIRVIPRDTWDMFLAFVETVGEDLGSYDDSEAWPSLLDDFVEYENDRQNQNLCLDVPAKD